MQFVYDNPALLVLIFVTAELARGGISYMGESEHWHLDKRVPLALIFTLMVQTGAGVWWAATMSGQVSQNSLAIARLDSVTEAQRVAAQSQAVQLGRIEEQISGLRGDIVLLLSAIEQAPRRGRDLE